MNMNNQIKYPVAEQFVSINGEGTKAGELAVFIPGGRKDGGRTGGRRVPHRNRQCDNDRRRTVAADRTCGSDKRTVVCGKSC